MPSDSVGLSSESRRDCGLPRKTPSDLERTHGSACGCRIQSCAFRPEVLLVVANSLAWTGRRNENWRTGRGRDVHQNHQSSVGGESSSGFTKCISSSANHRVGLLLLSALLVFGAHMADAAKRSPLADVPTRAVASPAAGDKVAAHHAQRDGRCPGPPFLWCSRRMLVRPTSVCASWCGGRATTSS